MSIIILQNNFYQEIRVEMIIDNITSLKKLIPTNKSFTLIGGCFDLIHVGHISLLEFASSLEDLLVVAVLSDKNVRNYKGSGRPIITERQRSQMLASIKFVDFVYISDVNPNGYETICLLQPDSVIFGEDTSSDKKGRWGEIIKNCSPHTKIVTYPRYTEEDISTSLIVQKIRGMTL
jgi:cytidyltransferase-like protein